MPKAKKKAEEPAEKFNLQQHVTNQILEALETGVKPWQKGWKSKGNDLTCGIGPIPVNLKSKKHYRGINILLLWDAAEKAGYTSRYWLTYKQATELGGTVRKGEKSTMVGFYSTYSKCEAHKEAKQEDCKHCQKGAGFWRYYSAFNVEQCEGIEIPDVITVDEPERKTEANKWGEAILKNSGAKIIHKSALKSPCYSPVMDEIRLPHQAQFVNDEAYYATALHELTHWTGAEKRLNRQFGKRFGDEAYAFEELVAELGSAFLCAEIGNQGTLDRHASYIDNWINVLKRDKAAIFTAASKASDAFEYCLAFKQDVLMSA